MYFMSKNAPATSCVNPPSPSNSLLGGTKREPCVHTLTGKTCEAADKQKRKKNIIVLSISYEISKFNISTAPWTPQRFPKEPPDSFLTSQDRLESSLDPQIRAPRPPDGTLGTSSGPLFDTFEPRADHRGALRPPDQLLQLARSPSKGAQEASRSSLSSIVTNRKGLKIGLK